MEPLVVLFFFSPYLLHHFFLHLASDSVGTTSLCTAILLDLNNLLVTQCLFNTFLTVEYTVPLGRGDIRVSHLGVLKKERCISWNSACGGGHLFTVGILNSPRSGIPCSFFSYGIHSIALRSFLNCKPCLLIPPA